MSQKRILWIFGHTTLRKWEVPLLQRLGYEVYCPKSYRYEAGDLSVCVSYEYDESLTLESEIINELNEIDFYQPLSHHQIEMINDYFDIAFCMMAREPLLSLLKAFRGNIVLHAFGLTGDSTYADVLTEICGSYVLNMISKCENRFWFSYTYSNLIETEPEVIRRRGVFMPISFPEDSTITWEGGDERFLFISPKIKTSMYYGKVYSDFKERFSDIPHVIGGGQMISVPEDPNVTGFLPRDRYEYNMRHLSAMFYHSQERHHLHYHPVEAVRIGMPLVFMAGGMLDAIGGKALPGRCKTIKEARRKLLRLSKGDKRLIRKIINTQKVLLEVFDDKYCVPYWERAMKKISSTEKKIDKATEKRIAVIIPAPYTGGILDFTIRFLRVITRKPNTRRGEIKVVFGYPRELEDIVKENRYYQILRDSHILFRPFMLLEKNVQWVNMVDSLGGYQPEEHALMRRNTSFGVFDDGTYYFADCDYAFIMNDRHHSGSPIFMRIPFAIVCHDFISRYVPRAIDYDVKKNKIANMHEADYVIVTSEPSKQDAIGMGIPVCRIKIIPNLFDTKGIFDAGIEPDTEKPEQYLVWSTNATKHKNHITMLKALEHYYASGGNLNVYITGANTEYFRDECDLEDTNVDTTYVKSVREMIFHSRPLKEHIKICGKLEKTAYYEVIANAVFMLCPQYGDNGNYGIVEAACFMKPSLCSDYPAMRYLAESCGIFALYCDPFDKTDIMRKLVEMEKHSDLYAAQLPTRKELLKCDCMQRADEVWAILNQMVMF